MNKLQLKIDILKIKIRTLKKVRSDVFFGDGVGIIDFYIKKYQDKLIKLLEKKFKIKF